MEYENAKTAAKAAHVAATAANAALAAASAAANLLAQTPDAWDFADHAYWLCRAAQRAAEDAADGLFAEWADEYPWVLSAFAAATQAAEDAEATASVLVDLAEEAGHTITR